MRRKVFCALLCLCIVLGSFTLDVFAAKSNTETVDWGLTLTADNITPTGLVLVISQSGGNYTGRLEYGSVFWLERWEENTWKPVPYAKDFVAWTLEASDLPVNSVCRLKKSWESIYGVLPDGHYRLVKELWDYRDPGDYDTMEFGVEFVITADHVCCSEDQDQLCDVCLALSPHECRDNSADRVCDICGKEADYFCVTGDAEWMGHWEPDNDLGIMSYVGNGIYRKEFEDVPPGSYSLKITKNGKWDGAYGVNGENYTFTVREKCTITVDLKLVDGVGVISVYGYWFGWDDDEDEDPEKSADTDDLPVTLSVVLLLTCAASLFFVLHKKEV